MPGPCGGKWRLSAIVCEPRVRRGSDRIRPVNKLLRYAGQLLAYAIFMGVIGYLSASPSYTHLPQDQALIKVSFSHAGAAISECRRLTPEDLAKLAPNMRKPTDCPRERVPLLLRVDVDGEPVLEETLEPTGLWKDGPSNVYRKIPVAAGPHELALKLRDSRRKDGFDYVELRTAELIAGQNFVVDFSPSVGGFVLR